GSRDRSSARCARGAFIIRYLRPRAAITDASIVSTAAISADRWVAEAGWATRIAWDARTSAIGRSPFMASVDPVETRSTIASARPRFGATSTAPDSGITSTATPIPAKYALAAFGWDVATRRPARSSTVVWVDVIGTATARRQWP